MRTPADDRYLSPFQLAMMDTRLGEFDAALSCLTDAVALRDFNFVSAGVGPAFNVLRCDARFAALLTAHGMAAVATR